MNTKIGKLMIIAAAAIFCTAAINAVFADRDAPVDSNVSTDNKVSAGGNVSANLKPLAPAQPASQPPASINRIHSLSLSAALERAIRDNYLFRIERINTDIACAIVREQEAAYNEPRLRASYTAGRSERQPFAESHNLSVSVADSYKTGTVIEAGVGASPYSRAGSTDNFQNSVGVTITQALLQGFGVLANTVPLRKARLDAQIRMDELGAYAQRLISDVERAYWDLLLSGEQVNIYQYSLELAQRLLYESEERLKIGGIAPIDLIAIRAEVASRERQLFDAQTSYRQKTLYLVYQMNAPEFWEAEFVLTDTSAVALLGDADPVPQHIEAAYMYRPDYLTAFMQAQKGELDLVQTKNGLLPKLDVFFSLQGVTPSETFSDALLPGYGGSFSAAVSGGLTLNFPIKNTVAKERRHRTEYSVEQQKISIENYARLIEYEIRSAHIEVQRAKRQIETAQMVSALQSQKLEAEQDKMNAGKSTSYAVLQVQRDVVMAHLDEAQARTAYVGALITLYSKDGTLLRRRGVKY